MKLSSKFQQYFEEVDLNPHYVPGMHQTEESKLLALMELKKVKVGNNVEMNLSDMVIDFFSFGKH